MLELLSSSRKASICFISFLDNCNSIMLKITNKAFNCIKYLDFEILKVITINNANKLDNSILYKYILLLQMLKKVVAKIN